MSTEEKIKELVEKLVNHLAFELQVCVETSEVYDCSDFSFEKVSRDGESVESDMRYGVIIHDHGNGKGKEEIECYKEKYSFNEEIEEYENGSTITGTSPKWFLGQLRKYAKYSKVE